MAYVRGQVSQNQKQVLNLQTFNGGINNVDDYMDNNSFVDMLNMDYFDNNVLQRRKGLVRDDNLNDKNSFLVGATFADFYHPYNKPIVDIFSSPTQHLISYKDSAMAIRPGSISSGINYMGNYFYLVGGELRVLCDVTNIVWGTYSTHVGQTAGGVLELKVISPVDGYTPLDTTHTRGVTHYDFTNYTVEYRPCQNELVDPYKGKNVVPRGCLYISDLKGRVYMSGVATDDDNVFIGDTGNPYYFPPGLAIQVPPDSDKIVGLEAYDDGMIIFRNQDIYIIRGITNNPTLGLEVFTLQKLNSSVGMISPNFCAKAQTYLFFVGHDFNVYALTSTNFNDKRLNVQKINKTVNITKAPFDLDRQEFTYGSCIFHDDKLYICTESKMVIYNFKHMSWHRYYTPQIWSMAYHPDNYIRFTSPTAWAMRFSLDEVYTDMGAPMVCYAKTKTFDMESGMYYKLFKGMYLSGDLIDDRLHGVITFTIDEHQTTSLDLTKYAKAKYGSTNYGESRLFAYDRVVTDRFDINRRGYRISIEWRYAPDGGMHFLRNQTFNPANSIDGGVDARAYDMSLDKMYKVVDRGGTLAYQEIPFVKDNKQTRIYQIDIEYEMRGRR